MTSSEKWRTFARKWYGEEFDHLEVTAPNGYVAFCAVDGLELEASDNDFETYYEEFDSLPELVGVIYL